MFVDLLHLWHWLSAEFSLQHNMNLISPVFIVYSLSIIAPYVTTKNQLAVSLLKLRAKLQGVVMMLLLFQQYASF